MFVLFFITKSCLSNTLLTIPDWESGILHAPINSEAAVHISISISMDAILVHMKAGFACILTDMHLMFVSHNSLCELSLAQLVAPSPVLPVEASMRKHPCGYNMLYVMAWSNCFIVTRKLQC